MSGGYDPLLFVHEIGVNMLCCICNLVPRNPWSLPCSHTICDICLEAADGNIRCPRCLEELQLNDDVDPVLEVSVIDRSHATPNQVLKEEIYSMLKRCPHATCIHHSADNPIRVSEFDKHLKTCEHRLVTCRVCHSKMRYIDLRNHPHFEMPEQEQVPGVDTIWQDLMEHVSITNEETECDTCQRLIPAGGYLKHVIYENGFLMTSDNGHYIYPVNNLAEARQQAMDRVVRVIKSPVFLTSPNGYTLSVILYLDGNDEGLHTHISVYIAVMHGKFDDELTWPFTQTVSLTLRNLRNPDANIQRVINPQDYPQCFAKPSSGIDMNDKAGFPRFALQSEVFCATSDFIDEDDVMFLEVHVDSLASGEMRE